MRTKIARDADHAACLKNYEALVARQQAARDQAEAELKAAQAEFDAWDAPRRRLEAAKERLRSVTMGGYRRTLQASAAVVAAAEPCLAKEIQRLEREIVNAGSLFRSYGAGESNAAAINAYVAGCREAIGRLSSLQSQPHDEESAQEAIRNCRRTCPPRPSPEYV